MIRRRHGKTPYELLHDKPPDLSYLHVFGALCYPTNDSENLGKLQPKADIGIFIGYAPTKKAFRIYNKRTRRIIETIHVDFDELTAMASEHSSSGPALHEMTPVSISSGLSLNPPPNVDLQAPEVIAPILKGSASVKILYQLFSKSQSHLQKPNLKYALKSTKKYVYESCDPVDTPMVENVQNCMRYRRRKAMIHHTIKSRSCLMEISIADQIALDDALEATLQVVYDVLKLTPFYKAFQVTADAPEIYMQEFWASAYVHNRSVRFKMNNKKHIIGLDQFRDILQICPKVGNKKFVEPPLEKEILIFLAFVVGIPSYDSLRLSQAQILWGMYNKKNVDYAYLLWEDFIFKIENKNTKKGNAMYYPRFTKLVVNFVMEKDPSIPRRNKVNWHYVRDDPMFTTINVISRNEVTQLYGAILPVALTNEDIRNSESYKEYYAMASGTIPPKTKGSKKKANTDTITKQKPPTAPTEKKSGKGKLKTTELESISEADLTKAEQLKIITKRSRQETHSSHASGSGADEGTSVTPGVPDAPNYDSEDDNT
ncbi:retrovirus-related pol polyprotein from transposon TNT 1-94 [Tanacetum coccineum]